VTVAEVQDLVRHECLAIARSLKKGAEQNGDSLVKYSYPIDENIYDRIGIRFINEGVFSGDIERAASAFHDWGPGNHTQMVVRAYAVSAQNREYGLALTFSEEVSAQIASLPRLAVER
jgi:hypothetical protein